MLFRSLHDNFSHTNTPSKTTGIAAKRDTRGERDLIRYCRAKREDDECDAKAKGVCNRGKNAREGMNRSDKEVVKCRNERGASALGDDRLPLLRPRRRANDWSSTSCWLRARDLLRCRCYRCRCRSFVSLAVGKRADDKVVIEEGDAARAMCATKVLDVVCDGENVSWDSRACRKGTHNVRHRHSPLRRD